MKRYAAVAMAGLMMLAGAAGCVSDGKDGKNGQNGTPGTEGPQGSDGAKGQDGRDGAGQVLAMERIGRTQSQGFNVSAAEIVAFDTVHKRIFSVNARTGRVDVFNAETLTDTAIPLLVSLDLGEMLVNAGKVAGKNLVGAANSIAIHGDLAAVAVEASPKTNPGWVVFFHTGNMGYLEAVSVGAQPDMVAFTPDGSQVLSANEGEPDAGYQVDPEGSVSIIRVADYSVTTIGFEDFNEGGPRHGELPLKKMVLDGYSATNPGNRASVAQSLEPEYIAFNEDGSRAYVALQENNAIAVLNLTNNRVEKIWGLGFKDHSIPGNELDAGDEDGGVRIKNWPVKGIYMPDSIATMTFNGKTYLLTANEGDSREDFLTGISDQTSCEASGYYFRSGECLDEVRVKHLVSRGGLTLGAGLAGLDTDANLGRLKASYHTTRILNGNSRTNGTDKTKPIETVYAYGGRSFSIWDAETGEQIFDSGNQFEVLTALRYGEKFNNNHSENKGDSRSDDKGPEPEAITVATIKGHTYAFIGLERMGGIMVYDVSNPYAPSFVHYINNRDLDVEPAGDATSYTSDAGDLGPEGFHFVDEASSPSGSPLLIVGNEVSGTVGIYEIRTTPLNAR
ncbi:choice-of-anchor I family protein [Desulfobotulus sp.]|uniref:choice-of-anchor I family protein n=1 Tax=Desulfobotulus sp. TaxID=1940337 RepID=UPI002A35E8F1|nr:choice-of-anchor I family protein [Desulfobotulus sp.]MDY0164102.1 choice-of-anchor I family protein [Desulfobotulus sp.]